MKKLLLLSHRFPINGGVANLVGTTLGVTVHPLQQGAARAKADVVLEKQMQLFVNEMTEITKFRQKQKVQFLIEKIKSTVTRLTEAGWEF